MYLADSKGFHRFPAADLEHEGVVHTAVISALLLLVLRLHLSR